MSRITYKVENEYFNNLIYYPTPLIPTLSWLVELEEAKNFKIMKRILFLILALVAMAPPAVAQVQINATNFPDANFRSYVSDATVDLNQDGYLSDEEINKKRYIYVQEHNITSLKGIEFFTKLLELSCYKNQLTELDVSKNTMLTELRCGHNPLTELDVSKNKALEKLECQHSQLTSLVFSKNTLLTYLRCDYNQLTTLNVSGCSSLATLYCHDNQLTSLDVSKNTALTRLFCSSNQIKGDKMQVLVESLRKSMIPNWCELYVVNKKDSNEGNVITKSQVAIANGRIWKVFEYSDRVEYAGSEDDVVAAGTYVISITQKVTDLSAFGPQAEMAIPYLSLLGIVDQEQRDGLTVFKSKAGGKELMVYDPSAKTITVCDGVTSADNLSYEIAPEMHQFIKMMNKNVDPFEGYDRLLIKFELESTSIGGVKAEGLDKGAWYTLDGKKLSSEPTKKGVYIYKGKKVVK